MDKPDPLSCEPGHLLPIAFGLVRRQDWGELAQCDLLTEKYRPPDHREIVADHRDLCETIGPFIDHAVPQDPHWIEMWPFGAKDRRTHGLFALALHEAPLVFGVDRGTHGLFALALHEAPLVFGGDRLFRCCNEPRPDPHAVGT